MNNLFQYDIITEEIFKLVYHTDFLNGNHTKVFKNWKLQVVWRLQSQILVFEMSERYLFKFTRHAEEKRLMESENCISAQM